MQKSLCDQRNEFQLLVLNALVLSIDKDCYVNPKFLAFFTQLEKTLMEDKKLFNEAEWLHTTSNVQGLYWRILANCYSKIAIPMDDFEWIQCYSSVISDLTVVYYHYCKLELLPANRRVIANNMPDKTENMTEDMYM